MHKNICEMMLNAIGDSLSNLGSSDDVEDGEIDDDDEENWKLGQLSKEDKPGQVIGTISKMILQHKEYVWHKQMRLDKLIQPG